MRFQACCFVLCILFSIFTGAPAPRMRDSADFDYFLLAQFWPATSCIYFENQGETCLVPQGVDGWTIHGLWPSIPGSSTTPEYCNDTWKFDFNEIKSLETTLEINWPYYDSAGPEDDLWEHEWEKHGTCAVSVSAVNSIYNYFNTTLNLHSTLNTISILEAGNIYPNDTAQYTPQQIFDILKAGYGKTPDITCLYDEEAEVHHLEQVYLCFDKSFNMIDCPDSSATQRKTGTLYFKSEAKGSSIGSYEGCPMSGTVYYKPIPQTSYKKTKKISK